MPWRPGVRDESRGLTVRDIAGCETELQKMAMSIT